MNYLRRYSAIVTTTKHKNLCFSQIFTHLKENHECAELAVSLAYIDANYQFMLTVLTAGINQNEKNQNERTCQITN
jgi:hypothetical protein